MCCSLRTQTMVAAVICCFVTSCSVCDEISNRICFFFCDDLSDFLSNESDGRGDIFEDLVKVAVYVFCMVSDVLCLFNKKNFALLMLFSFVLICRYRFSSMENSKIAFSDRKNWYFSAWEMSWMERSTYF